jgi:hypothetical protein
MNSVEQKPKKHVPQRGFPRDVSVHEEPRFLLPRRIVQFGKPLFEIFGMTLVGGERFWDGGSRMTDEAHLSFVTELTRVAELAREQPYEIPGGSRAGMRFVGGLVGRDGLQDPDELWFFRLEALTVILAKILHGTPPSTSPG